MPYQNFLNMKKISTFLTSLVIFFGLTACAPVFYSDDVVMSYGTPYYENGILIYYSYHGMYYYPHYHGNVCRLKAYRTPQRHLNIHNRTHYRPTNRPSVRPSNRPNTRPSARPNSRPSNNRYTRPSTPRGSNVTRFSGGRRR